MVITNINVGMGEIQISNSQSAIIAAPGLGSCIGLIMYDPIAKIGGMAHVVLPDSTNNTKIQTLPGKYADTAIPELLAQLIKKGALKKQIVVKIAGGAQMFNLEKGGNILNIGLRNVVAVKSALTKEGLNVKGADTGGNKGRTLKLEVSTCKVLVKTIGQQEIEI